MSKKIITVLGAAFILIGLIGLVTPHFMGTHLTKAHNLIHFCSGAIALYFGQRAAKTRARQFAWVFGIAYGLLGIAGFVEGVPIVASFHGMEQSSTDSHLLQIIPGVLVLGTADHIVHSLLGLVFVLAAIPIPLKARSRQDFPERLTES